MFQEIKHQPTLKVGIIRSSAIGDVVLATSLLDLLESLPIRWEVTWICREPALSLLRKSWPNVNLVSLDQDNKIILKALGNCHFVIDLQNTPRTTLIRQSYKFATKRPTYASSKNWISRRALITQSYIHGRNRDFTPEADDFNYLKMVGTLKKALSSHLPAEHYDTIHNAHAEPRLPLSHISEMVHWKKTLGDQNWLAIAPGASYAPKQAPIDLFSRILEDLFKKIPSSWKSKFGILLVGTKNERALTRQLLDNLSWTPTSLNLAGELTLAETATVLKYSRILLGNDSAPAHIAEAVKTPVSILFGPTVENFGFAPHRPASRVFSVPLGCRPCSLHGKSPCRFKDYLCYQGIQPQIVAEHIMGQLWIDNIPPIHQ